MRSDACRTRTLVGALLWSALVSCAPAEPTSLVVDLRTDHRAGREFVSVHLLLWPYEACADDRLPDHIPAEARWLWADPDGDYLDAPGVILFRTTLPGI